MMTGAELNEFAAAVGGLLGTVAGVLGKMGWDRRRKGQAVEQDRPLVEDKKEQEPGKATVTMEILRAWCDEHQARCKTLSHVEWERDRKEFDNRLDRMDDRLDRGEEQFRKLEDQQEKLEDLIDVVRDMVRDLKAEARARREG